MAPKNKKPKKPKPAHGYLKPKKPKKPKPPRGGKKSGKTTSTPSGDDVGGTINAITCTLNFSADATAVSIGVSTLESTVDKVQVLWSGNQIYETVTWNDPVLQAIPYACPAGIFSLQVKLYYSQQIYSYRKLNIYPSGGASLTVTLPKI
jgi:hypothetical protein